jgi:TRAP transporter 4TM/12TM fusion protein
MTAGGFRPRFAASVEAIASNGGQFMPPIMGAAAFIMPFFIPGATYGDVCLAALLPAVLYFLSLYTVVHLEARKLGMTGLPRETLPRLWPTLKSGWPLAFSLATIVGLLIYGFTPMTVGVWATLVTFAVTLLRRETRLTPGGFLAALEVGVQRTIPIAIACAAAGIIIGAMNLSGLAARISSVILAVSEGQLWIALLLTMVVAILLGMGVTTAIVYITLVALVVPSLVDMGAHPMAANMFVFYFGALSGVTPPVCLTTYAAAGIAQSNPWHTGWLAARVGLASFIVPFMIAYTPELLLIGSWYNIMLAFGTAALGVVCLAAALQGWVMSALAWWERLSLLAAAGLLIHPDLGLGLAGAALAIMVYMHQRGHTPLAAAPKESR